APPVLRDDPNRVAPDQLVHEEPILERAILWVCVGRVVVELASRVDDFVTHEEPRRGHVDGGIRGPRVVAARRAGGAGVACKRAARRAPTGATSAGRSCSPG